MAAPRSLAGWLAIALHFLSVHRRGHPALVHLVSDTVQVATREPVEAQLDGDAVGRRRRMSCRVRPGSLNVRVDPDGGIQAALKQT